MKDYKPKLVCFSCKFGWGYLAHQEHPAPEIENGIPVTCSGKVDTEHILNAFKQGADGVLILGCEDGECHFQDGNFQTVKKVYLLQKVLAGFGIEQERVKVELSRAPYGKKIPQLINEMKRDLAKLGPITKILAPEDMKNARQA